MGALFDLFAKLTLDSKEYDDGLDNAEKKGKGFGKVLSSATKIGVAAFAAVGTAAVGAGAAISKGAGEVASFGDVIDKESQKLGISAEAYQEWDAILRHTGGSVDNLKPALKTLSKEIVNNSDAFKQLGISQEEMKNSSVEDVLNMTIEKLQDMPAGVERTRLATQLLGKSSVELGALLNTSSEETEKMRQRVHELGGVMSDEAVKSAAAYQDQLQDMNTAISSVKRGLISEFLPSLTTVMGGITEIFGGDGDNGGALLSEGISGILDKFDEAIPKFAEKAFTIISAFGTAISEHLPSIMEKGAEIVLNIATGIVQEAPNALMVGAQIVGNVASAIFEAIPTLLETGAQMVKSLASGLANGIPQFVSQAMSMILKFTESLGTSASTFVDAGISLILSLTQGIIDAVPSLLENLPQIIANIVGVLIENGPKLIQAGIDLLAMLAKGIVESIPAVVATIPEIFSSLKEKWNSVDWIGLGKNVINFIVNGVRSLFSSIPAALKNIGTNAVSWFKQIDWVSAGIEAINSIVGAITGLFNDIPNALKSIGESAMSAFGDINWYSIGSNVIDGIASGIRNGVESIKSAAKNAAERAFNAAKNFLEIQSPSKKARREIGLMYGKGMALGIDDSRKDIDKAVDKLNADLDGIEPFDPFDFTPKPNPAAGGAAAIAATDRPVNITINSTVDGTENPEEYAGRLVRELELQLRAV